MNAPRAGRRLSPWMLFGVAAFLGGAIPGIGFRILYDSVTPEVALFVASGFVFGVSNDVRRAGIALAGFLVGMAVCATVFPAQAPAAHIAQYGPPAPPSAKAFLLIPMFPTAGTVVGAIVRKLA